jgi:hypothetical protein
LTRIRAFNERLAEQITKAVGSMWCAYAFAAIALVSLPGALATRDPVVIVAWIAQTFLQLILLSILMVGQQRSSDWLAAELRETHDAVIGRVDALHEKHDAIQAQVGELHDLQVEGRLPRRLKARP